MNHLLLTIKRLRKDSNLRCVAAHHLSRSQDVRGDIRSATTGVERRGTINHSDTQTKVDGAGLEPAVFLCDGFTVRCPRH